MDTTIVSALSAILGSAVGGSVTLATAYYTKDAEQAPNSPRRDSKA